MHEKLILINSNFQSPLFLDFPLKLRIFDEYAELESLNRYFSKKRIRSRIASTGGILLLDVDCNVEDVQETMQSKRGCAGRISGELKRVWHEYRTATRELKIPRGKLVLRSGFPLIMGILNITPDSFYDGSKFFDKDRAVECAIQMQEDGADIIDIGGQSTRPGSTRISAEEEIDRVIPVLLELKDKLKIPVSIDTYYSKVARTAIENGAEIINDTSALTIDEEEMLQLVKDFDVSVILMHYYKTLQPMQAEPVYADVLYDIACWLRSRVNFLLSNNISANKIIIDPGIGFGKLVEHNVEILYKLDSLRGLGFPILVGPSRKSFIGSITKDSGPQNRLAGTISSCILSMLKGALIIRVHDVKEVKKALEVGGAILSGT